MAFRMKRILNEQKMIERAVVNKTLISAKWASDSSSVEAIIVPDCESFLFTMNRWSTMQVAPLEY